MLDDWSAFFEKEERENSKLIIALWGLHLWDNKSAFNASVTADKGLCN